MTPKWEIEDSGFKLAVPSWPSATARPNGSKESPGALGRRVRIVHELDQARTGNRQQKVGKGRRMRREEQRENGGIYGR